MFHAFSPVHARWLSAWCSVQTNLSPVSSLAKNTCANHLHFWYHVSDKPLDEELIAQSQDHQMESLRAVEI